MKKTLFLTSLVAPLFLSGAVFAAPSSGASVGGGAAGGAHVAPGATPRTGIIQPNSTTSATGTPTTSANGTPTTSINGTPTTPANGINGVPGNTLSPQPGTPNANASSLTGNSLANTNGISGGMTNSLPGTNAFVEGGTLPPPTIPTVNPPNNYFPKSTDINGNHVTADQTVTSSDRALLSSLSQGVKTSLGVPQAGNLPVHFLINNGVVTVVGTAQNQAQSQGILSQVRQTPGVVSVVSDLRVAQPFGSTQNGANSSLFGAQTDHAFTARDQTLLTTVQQQAGMQLGINNTAQMPVHFSIQGGVVGVTGHMISLQEKQALLSAISKTPGVTRVVDNINLQSAPGMNTMQAAPGMNNRISPTSRSSGSNTIFLNTTNPSGF